MSDRTTSVDRRLDAAGAAIAAAVRNPIGALAGNPAVAFGLRAAALAGLVVTAGAAGALGFAGVLDDPSALADFPPSTTCCVVPL
ncbi:hypothetical protein V5P93_004472 [Actinokineospora auranticolor]|uniref:Uncharacterized protein n=1 Tax=Actinokineospora auranticolor TaxID=155976 RepID=A0A2S6GT80_9PSEU|nr:hypothetical protein [Actinokineospora auranticolor]PPK68420.1 hypothetical protein CLV40_105143 [Actinokineospora auranticolor]